MTFLLSTWRSRFDFEFGPLNLPTKTHKKLLSDCVSKWMDVWRLNQPFLCNKGFGSSSSWWFQPLWKILVKLDHLPQVGVNIKNIWNHHPVIYPFFLVAFNKKRVVIGDWKEGLSAELDAETAIQVILSKDVVDPCGPAASSLAGAVLCLLIEGTVYDVNWICLNVGQRRHDITVSLAGRIDIKKCGMGR